MVIERLRELESEGDAPAAKELARGVLQNDTVEHIEICEADDCVVVTTTHFRGEHDLDLANGVWRPTGTYRVRDSEVDVEIETSMHADAVEPYVRPSRTKTVRRNYPPRFRRPIGPCGIGFVVSCLWCVPSHRTLLGGPRFRRAIQSVYLSRPLTT